MGAAILTGKAHERLTVGCSARATLERRAGLVVIASVVAQVLAAFWANEILARTKRILGLERRARKMVDERDFRKLRRTAVEAFFANIEPVSVTGSAGMKSVDECPPKQSATRPSIPWNWTYERDSCGQ